MSDSPLGCMRNTRVRLPKFPDRLSGNKVQDYRVSLAGLTGKSNITHCREEKSRILRERKKAALNPRATSFIFRMSRLERH
jgi:hypothetical protein